jgi:hypothetical protein
LDLPAGSHQIAVRKAGDPAAATPVLSGEATVPAGGNVSLVAHLSATGTTLLTAFGNDPRGIPAGQARLIVRHVAAAPAIDVLSGGRTLIGGLTNPEEKAVTVPAGTITVAVGIAGMIGTMLGPETLSLPAGSVTVLYATGSVVDGTMRLITQPLATPAPATEEGGVGRRAWAGGVPWTAVLLLALAGLLLLTALGAIGFRLLAKRLELDGPDAALEEPRMVLDLAWAPVRQTASEQPSTFPHQPSTHLIDQAAASGASTETGHASERVGDHA